MSLLKVVAPADDESVSDAVLLRRFQQGRDPQAAELLVRRHGRLVMGVCSRILGRSGEADDAFQATFLVLIRGGLRIRQSQSLASWLYGTAWRVAIRLRKKLNRQRSLEACPEPLCEGDPFEQLVAKHDQEVLDNELAGLTERYREVLLLHYFEGQSQREIARTLGATESAVEGLLKRGRAQLRSRLSRRGVICATTLTAVVAQHQALQAAAWSPQVNVILEGATTLSPQVWEAVLRAPRAEELLPPEWTIMGLQKLSLGGIAVGGGAVIVSLLGWSLLGAGLTAGTGDAPPATAAVASNEIVEAATKGPAIEAAAPVPEQPAASAEGTSSVSGTIALPEGGMGGGGSIGSAGIGGGGGEFLGTGIGPGGGAGMMGGFGGGPMVGSMLSLPLDQETVDDLLSRPVQTGMRGMPWRMALEQFRSQSLPLEVNDEELKQYGVDLMQPVDMMIGQVSTRTALRLLLKPHGLEVQLVDGKLKIVQSMSAGIKTSSTSTQSDSSVRLTRLDGRPKSNSDDDEYPRYTYIQPQWRVSPKSEIERKLLGQLEQTTQFSFVDTPFKEALEFIGTYHKIQFVLDESVIADTKIGGDLPVTCELADIKLGSALKIFLGGYGLTCVIENEVIRITSIDAARKRRDKRVFNVRKLPESVLEALKESELVQVESIIDPDNNLQILIGTGDPIALDEFETLLQDLWEAAKE